MSAAEPSRPPAASPGHQPEAILRALLERRPLFLGYVQRALGVRSGAEDLLQEAYLVSLRHLKQLPSEAAAVAWFRRVLRNAAIDQHRRRGAAERAIEALGREPEAPNASEAQVPCPCVGALARDLAPSYAEALRLTEVEGVRLEDLAREAGITRGNAAVRAFRARKALRQRVAETCGACARGGCFDCTCDPALSSTSRSGVHPAGGDSKPPEKETST